MQLLPADQGFPYGTAKGTCYRCGGGPGGDGSNTVILDLMIQIDMEGWCMLCQGCGEAIASLLGCMPQVEAEQLRARIRATEDQLLDESRKTELLTSRMKQAIDA